MLGLTPTTERTIPVSYTHLDVYKRQLLHVLFTSVALSGDTFLTLSFILFTLQRIVRSVVGVRPNTCGYVANCPDLKLLSFSFYLQD